MAGSQESRGVRGACSESAPRYRPARRGTKGARLGAVRSASPEGEARRVPVGLADPRAGIRLPERARRTAIPKARRGQPARRQRGAPERDARKEIYLMKFEHFTDDKGITW